MTLSIIVAAAKNGVIGKDNKLLWHISEDLKYFKRTTLGKPVIMGRKTFDSLPFKPLPGRENIVVTRNSDWTYKGVKAVSSLAKAVQALSGYEEIMIIGGGQIYAEALKNVDRIYYTDVDLDIEGDTWFPPLSDEWTEVSREDHPAKDQNPAYSFLVYERG